MTCPVFTVRDKGRKGYDLIQDFTNVGDCYDCPWADLPIDKPRLFISQDTAYYATTKDFKRILNAGSSIVVVFKTVSI